MRAPAAQLAAASSSASGGVSTAAASQSAAAHAPPPGLPRSPAGLPSVTAEHNHVQENITSLLRASLKQVLACSITQQNNPELRATGLMPLPQHTADSRSRKLSVGSSAFRAGIPHATVQDVTGGRHPPCSAAGSSCGSCDCAAPTPTCYFGCPNSQDSVQDIAGAHLAALQVVLLDHAVTQH